MLVDLWIFGSLDLWTLDLWIFGSFLIFDMSIIIKALDKFD